MAAARRAMRRTRNEEVRIRPVSPRCPTGRPASSASVLDSSTRPPLSAPPLPSPFDEKSAGPWRFPFSSRRKLPISDIDHVGLFGRSSSHVVTSPSHASDLSPRSLALDFPLLEVPEKNTEYTSCRTICTRIVSVKLPLA